MSELSWGFATMYIPDIAQIIGHLCHFYRKKANLSQGAKSSIDRNFLLVSGCTGRFSDKQGP